jgi:hypothetical protein
MFAESAMSQQQQHFEGALAVRQQNIDAHNENRRVESQHVIGMKKASMKPVKFGGKVG